MHDMIGFKLYMMHRTQQLYDKDLDLLAKILDDQANDGIIFFSNELCFWTCEQA